MAKNTYELIFEAVDNTSKSVKRIESSVERLNQKTKNANSALSKIGTIGGKVAGTLGKLALAGTAAAGAFAFLAKKNLDAIDALGKQATKLGVSTKFLSLYSEVAREAGLSQEGYVVGVQRFIRRVGEAQKGVGTLIKPLQELGISLKDNNGNFKAGEEVFKEYIASLGGVEDGARRLALGFAGFDSEGTAFVNIAEMGSKAIQQIIKDAQLAGMAFDEDFVRGAERANDAIVRFTRRARSGFANFFVALAPGIEELANNLTQAIDEAIAGAGGMEAFSRRLAADFIRAGADLITSIASIFDGFIQGFNATTNVLKQVIVSISKIPGAGFDAEFGSNGISEKRALLEKELQVLKERKKVLEASSDTGKGNDILVPDLFSDAPSKLDGGKKGSLAVGLLNKDIAELIEQLNIVDNTIVFERQTNAASGMAEKVATTTSRLHEMANELDASADASAREAEIRAKFPYDVHADAITRLTLAKKEMTAATEAGTQADEIDLTTFLSKSQVMELAKEKYSEMTNSLTKTQNEQRILNATLMIARTRFQEGGMAVAYYDDMLDHLGQTTNDYSDYTMDFNKRLNENTMLEINRVKMLRDVNRRIEEGTLTGYRAEVALRMLGEATQDLNTKTGDTVQTYAEFTAELEKVAKNTVRTEGFQRRYLSVLEDIKKETGSLSEVQQEQYDQLKSALEETEKEGFSLAGSIKDAMGSAVSSISGAMADMLLGMGNGFESLQDIALNAVRSIIAALIEAQIQKAILGSGMGMSGGIGSILGLGASAIPGLGLLVGAGALLGGLFAEGGNVPSGRKPIIVGERGPELFLPGRSGQVVANHDVADVTSGENLTVNFNISAIDTQSGTEFLVQNKRVITGVVQDAFRRRAQSGPLG